MLNGVVIHALHTTGDRKLSPLRPLLPVVLGDQEVLPPNLTHRAEEEASECAGIGQARVPPVHSKSFGANVARGSGLHGAIARDRRKRASLYHSASIEHDRVVAEGERAWSMADDDDCH